MGFDSKDALDAAFARCCNAVSSDTAYVKKVASQMNQSRMKIIEKAAATSAAPEPPAGAAGNVASDESNREWPLLPGMQPGMPAAKSAANCEISLSAALRESGVPGSEVFFDVNPDED